MRLTVLGSGSCELRRGRSSPAYLLEHQGFHLLLDLGQGALRRLLESGADPGDLGAVFLSHAHPDHLADLVPLLFALNYDPALRGQAQISLLAHEGLAPLVAGLQGLFGHWLSPSPERLTPHWLPPGARMELGPFSLRVEATPHTPHSLACRLEAQGLSLVYLGDSPASPGLAELCQGAGLVICHCAGSDQVPKPGHMHPRAAGLLGREAGAGALLLSHLYREVDPGQALEGARAFFGGPLWAARDLMVLELGPLGARLAARGLDPEDGVL